VTLSVKYTRALTYEILCQEALAEIEQLKADQLSMVPNLNALLEEIETLKAAASDGSSQKELLQKQCDEMKAERDAHTAACSELMVKFEEQQREVTDLRAAAGEHELMSLALAELDRKCEVLQVERDAQAAACCELERKVEQMQGEIDAWQEASAEKVGAAQATAAYQQEELERHVAEAEASRQECEELRQKLARQAEVAGSEDPEHLKAELAIANTRIEELETRLLARKEEERKRTSMVFDEILKSNEDSYSQQYEFLNQVNFFTRVSVRARSCKRAVASPAGR
jgi:chromosome segregation ATPase